MAQKQQAQEQQAASEPDSPMLDPNKKAGFQDLEAADHNGAFNQEVAAELLSQGQDMSIGSPETFVSPAYASAAGVKGGPDAAAADASWAVNAFRNPRHSPLS